MNIPVVDVPDQTLDTATETLLELAQPELKIVGGQVSLPFLLEIGTEEIPDWMIPTALENLRLSFEKLEIPHDFVRLDATPRRLVLRAEGLPARKPDSVERVIGPFGPPEAVAGFGQGIGPMKVESTPEGEATLLEKGAGPQHYRCSRRSLPA